ncbi:MAG TPA: single-stranded-DNA-specific exonuclease RecJ [Edaphobacter sp.]|nr:single-stranded-DNA-specific exonuclease RecJ [Edaphobacter sp.]
MSLAEGGLDLRTGQQQQWTEKAHDAAVAARLATELGCPEAIATVLVSRGIADAAQARRFFHPSPDDLIDPLQMLGMTAAVKRIRQAVQTGEPILIYGDYDVDGTTATVLLKTAIERSAKKDRPAIVRYHVPHRLREGYGMQASILGEAAAAGIRLVISVDTGIRAFAAAAEAKALGLDLIVTDHHLPDDAAGVPEALAVINPAQKDCGYPFKSLCGAGVAFKLAHAILEAAAEDEQERDKLRRSLIPSFLKLVAIATIADAVPLEGENRAIAWLGLEALRNPVQPGLRALMQVAQIPVDRPPTPVEVGFRLAPRINAAGRMDIASDVVELFLTRDTNKARELAEKLDHLNEERRTTEAKALEAIDERLALLRDADGNHVAECLVLDGEQWHRGVLGILASRVVDRTGRPALVLTHEDGQAHGSGRSVPGFHLLDALTAVHAEDDGLFSRFGGHAHAVGFSLPSDRVEVLRGRMRRYGMSLLTGAMLAPPLEFDAEVALSDLTPKFYAWLESCGPFGVGNPEPVFVSRSATLLSDVRLIKEKHVCLQLRQAGSGSFSALGWSRAIDWVARCTALELRQGAVIDIAYRLKAKTNPQFPGLELELLGLNRAESV